MRGVLLSLVWAAGILAAAPATSSATSASTTPAFSAVSGPAPVFALQTTDKTIDINIHNGGGRWYRNPVWIAIGAIAAVIVLLLIVLIARGGGGTTIVKD